MSSVSDIAPGGARTIVVNGNGTGTLTFEVPAGVTLDVESVLAQIDATGAGATTATLTIQDQSGVVIATKHQTETVDAGGTGSATWALRLTDDGGGGSGGSGIFFDTDPQTGHFFEMETTGAVATRPNGDLHLHSDSSSGMFLEETQGAGIALSTTTPFGPTPIINPGGGGIQVYEGNGGITIIGHTSGTWEQDGALVLTANGTTITLNANTELAIVAPALSIDSLPTSDPVAANQIWADNGVLVYSGHTVPGSGGIVFGTPNVGTDLSIETTTGDITLQLATGQRFFVNDSGGNELASIHEDGLHEFDIGAGKTFTVYDPSLNPLLLIDAAGNTTVGLGSGATFTVNDSSGNPVFEVRDDGSIHGLASVGAITWDL